MDMLWCQLDPFLQKCCFRKTERWGLSNHWFVTEPLPTSTGATIGPTGATNGTRVGWWRAPVLRDNGLRFPGDSQASKKLKRGDWLMHCKNENECAFRKVTLSKTKCSCWVYQDFSKTKHGRMKWMVANFITLITVLAEWQGKVLGTPMTLISLCLSVFSAASVWVSMFSKKSRTPPCWATALPWP